MDSKEYRSTLKSSDTEEHVDIYFYRPIGYQWARLFRAMKVTPNMVTVLSIFLGVGAGILFGFEDFTLNVVGILLLIWANMYDSADGQLARLTNQKSELGRILDGAAGDLWFISIYVALAVRLTPSLGVWAWVLSAISGFLCHAPQSRLADYYRQIHLYFLKGAGGSELSDAHQQVEVYRQLSWRHQFVQKFFQFFYVNYTQSQEKATPCFQVLRKSLAMRCPCQMPDVLRKDFCAGSLPLMKYCNILTFNWRSITLAVSLLSGHPMLYLLVEMVVFSGIYVYMRRRHERLCRSMTMRLDSYLKE